MSTGLWHKCDLCGADIPEKVRAEQPQITVAGRLFDPCESCCKTATIEKVLIWAVTPVPNEKPPK